MRRCSHSLVLLLTSIQLTPGCWNENSGVTGTKDSAALVGW